VKKLLRDRKFWFLVFSLFCFIAIGVCVIVDWAINNNFTWAVYPLISIVFFWLVMMPFFWLRYSLFWQVVVLSVLILPYLYLLDRCLPHAGWFQSIALPVALFGVTAVLLTYMIIRFTKINIWYRLSIASLLLLVLINPLLQLYINNSMGTELEMLDMIANIFGGVVTAGVFSIVGYASSTRKLNRKLAKKT